MSGRRIDFDKVARAALSCAHSIVRQWVPNGKQHGAEWVCLNPKRSDRRLGSFKINTKTGAWADFSSGDSGGDLVSLAAYLFDLSQREAAERIASMLSIDPHE